SIRALFIKVAWSILNASSLRYSARWRSKAGNSTNTAFTDAIIRNLRRYATYVHFQPTGALHYPVANPSAWRGKISKANNPCATFARLFERCWARMNKHGAADVPEIC